VDGLGDDAVDHEGGLQPLALAVDPRRALPARERDLEALAFARGDLHRAKQLAARVADGHPLEAALELVAVAAGGQREAAKGRVKWRWRFMWSVLLVLSGEALLEGWNTLAGDSWES